MLVFRKLLILAIIAGTGYYLIRTASVFLQSAREYKAKHEKLERSWDSLMMHADSMQKIEDSVILRIGERSKKVLEEWDRRSQ